MNARTALALVVGLTISALFPRAGAAQATPAAVAIDPALEATARTSLVQADRLGRIADRIRIPRLSHVTTSAKMSEWMRTRFAPALRRKMEAIYAAEAAYSAVVALGPTVSSVRAMRRAADLYATLVTALERIPAPLEIRRQPELHAAFQRALAEQMTPLRERAREAYEACVARARALGVTSADAEAAARALAQLATPP